MRCEDLRYVGYAVLGIVGLTSAFKPGKVKQMKEAGVSILDLKNYPRDIYGIVEAAHLFHDDWSGGYNNIEYGMLLPWWAHSYQHWQQEFWGMPYAFGLVSQENRCKTLYRCGYTPDKPEIWDECASDWKTMAGDRFDPTLLSTRDYLLIGLLNLSWLCGLKMDSEYTTVNNYRRIPSIIRVSEISMINASLKDSEVNDIVSQLEDPNWISYRPPHEQLLEASTLYQGLLANAFSRSSNCLPS